ncbi:MAG: LysE family transporter [Firmicutes bacterium]|nr:LysE family transporter [Bacillota bacterium]
MLKYLLQGLILGFAYVAPIGTQNLYVINTSIRQGRSKALLVALMTVLFDISLAMSCFFGIGFVLSRLPALRTALLMAGSVAVTFIGVRLVRSPATVSSGVALRDSLVKVAADCFVVTWLNPQAIVDGTLLLGGMRASLSGEASNYFMLGVCSASVIWFTLLALLVSAFRSWLDRAVRLISMVCGAVIVLYGLRLGYSLIRSLPIGGM